MGFRVIMEKLYGFRVSDSAGIMYSFIGLYWATHGRIGFYRL